jgi:hypothetical protein
MQPLYDILHSYPGMREPIIPGILRRGEVGTCIAAPKSRKSWLMMDLAIAVATGRKWLDHYPVQQGNVLYLDAELYPECIAQRFSLVAKARGLSVHEIEDKIFVEPMRGENVQRLNIFELRNTFNAACAQKERGFYTLCIIDPIYKYYPGKESGRGGGFDENSNSDVSALYAKLDEYASEFCMSILAVHHASKGGSGGKSITDVGSGASAQARAVDTHLILRPHVENDAIVLEAASRSFPPITPMSFRWQFPVFVPAPDLDPANLFISPYQYPFAPRKKKVKPPKPTPRENIMRLMSIWTKEEGYISQDELFLRADSIGMSERVTRRTLRYGEKLHAFTRKKNRKPSEPASFKLGDIVTNENVAK